MSQLSENVNSVTNYDQRHRVIRTSKGHLECYILCAVKDCPRVIADFHAQDEACLVSNDGPSLPVESLCGATANVDHWWDWEANEAINCIDKTEDNIDEVL